MDSLKAVQRHLVLQQRWVKLCCVAVVLVTLVSLLLGTLGTDRAQLRSTGMGAFTEEDIGKYNLGHHVDTLKQAGSRIVKSLWWWSDEDEDDYMQEDSEQEAWGEPAAADAWSGGEDWNAQDQAELDAFVPEQGQGNGEWQEAEQQEWAPEEETWSEDASASEQAWQQEAGSSEEWLAAEQGKDPEAQRWERSADSAVEAEWPAEGADWTAEAEPAPVAEWAEENRPSHEHWEAESAAETGVAKTEEDWENPTAWGKPEVWEEAQYYPEGQQVGADRGAEWSETPQQDAWREEERWAEESQPSGPYKEEPVYANAEAWETMSEEAASKEEAYESEWTDPAAVAAAEEQAWEERPQWEEPAADWEASEEQASGNNREEWVLEGGAATNEWYDDGAMRDTVSKDAHSTEQPSEERRKDAAAWIAEDGK